MLQDEVTEMNRVTITDPPRDPVWNQRGLKFNDNFVRQANFLLPLRTTLERKFLPPVEDCNSRHGGGYQSTYSFIYCNYRGICTDKLFRRVEHRGGLTSTALAPPALAYSSAACEPRRGFFLFFLLSAGHDLPSTVPDLTLGTKWYVLATN